MDGSEKMPMLVTRISEKSRHIKPEVTLSCRHNRSAWPVIMCGTGEWLPKTQCHIDKHQHAFKFKFPSFETFNATILEMLY
jgi:hypothetical protein